MWWKRRKIALSREEAFVAVMLTAVTNECRKTSPHRDRDEITVAVRKLPLFAGLSESQFVSKLNRVESMLEYHGGQSVFKRSIEVLPVGLRQSAFVLLLQIALAVQEQEDKDRRRWIKEMQDKLDVDKQLAAELTDVLVAAQGR